MAYNNFLVKVGLYGSPLDWSYEDYGNLATKATWFHNLSILVHKFNVVLTAPKTEFMVCGKTIILSCQSSFAWGIAAKTLFC